MYKPIMCMNDEYNGFKYKYVHTAYAINVPIKFKTDLTSKEFENLCDGEYSGEDIEYFQNYGRFPIQSTLLLNISK